MPVMDGFKALKLLRESGHTKDIPVILSTAVPKETKQIEKGVALGALEYITNPIKVDLLVVREHTMLGKRREIEKSSAKKRC
jgi:CheY-like chemotaxis protein